MGAMMVNSGGKVRGISGWPFRVAWDNVLRELAMPGRHY